jgi:hypothetical protein
MKRTAKTKPAETVTEAAAAPVWTPAIKAFDKDMKCRGFQFEPGQTYRHEGAVKACQSGFHVIAGNPLAVFQYYSPAQSRFCRVEIAGATDTDDDGEKIAAEILRVGEEFGLQTLIEDAVKWVIDRAKPTGAASNSGSRGAASNSGYRGAASNSGEGGAAMSHAYAGKVMCEGEGQALYCSEFDDDFNLISNACGITGRDGIKAGVWYTCKDGKLVEAAE